MKKLCSLLLVGVILMSLIVSTSAHTQIVFTDVDATAWFYDSVVYVSDNGLIDGVSDDIFLPDENIKSETIVKALYRLEESPETEIVKFSDVVVSSETEKAVSWALKCGIVTGVNETQFAPNSSLTREQMATFIYRYAKYKNIDVGNSESTDISIYSDKDSISEYAVSAMKYAIAEGIISGVTENLLVPKGTLTRAQAAVMLKRLATPKKLQNNLIDEAELDELLEKIITENKIAGMSVAITDNEKVVYAKGFGVESVEQPQLLTTENTVYRLASLTKMVTGMTILSLVEEEVLDLDKPVKEYLPWLKLSNPKAEEQMTLRHLLSHTSGLPAGNITEGSRDEDTIEENLKEILPTCQLLSLPEEGKYKYSNLGFALAAQVATTVTGKMYSTLAKERVLKPLGMDKTTYDLHEAVTYPFSLPHVDDENGGLAVNHYLRMNTMFRASGGLYSNVLDLAKFTRCIMNGGCTDSGEQILGKEYVELMFTPKSQTSATSGNYYGMAGYMLNYNGRFLYGHNGSSTPYQTGLFIDKESGLGVIALMNTTRSGFNNEVPKMIFDALLNN